MISFNYETDFELDHEADFSKWLSAVILSENKKEGDINYVFCDDEYLLEINQQYLDHDTLTDIISFDYSVGNELHGDVFISVERVRHFLHLANRQFRIFRPCQIFLFRRLRVSFRLQVFGLFSFLLSFFRQDLLAF